MEANPFEAEVRRRPPAAVIELRGDVNALAETALNAAYQDASEGDPDTILLNFERVDYINSTGIALIVSVLAQARKERRTVVASGLNDHYREIFEITRLADFMQIFPDEETAVGEVAASAPGQG